MSKVIKDYNGQDLELPDQDEFIEHSCHKCGTTIAFGVEDNTLDTLLCEDCFDEVFPEETEDFENADDAVEALNERGSKP